MHQQPRDRHGFINKSLQSSHNQSVHSNMPYNQYNLPERQRSLTQFAETFSSAYNTYSSKVGAEEVNERSRNVCMGGMGNVATRDRNTGPLSVRPGNNLDVGGRSSLGGGPHMGIGSHTSVGIGNRNSMDVVSRTDIGSRYGIEEFNIPRQTTNNIPFDAKTMEKTVTDDSTKVMLDQISLLTKQVSKLVEYNEMLQEKVTERSMKESKEGLRDQMKDKKAKCWTCNEEGHYSRDCRQGRSPPKDVLSDKTPQFGHQDKYSFLNRDKEQGERDFGKNTFSGEPFFESGSGPYSQSGNSASNLPRNENDFTSPPLPHGERRYASSPPKYSDHRYTSGPLGERRYVPSPPPASRGDRHYTASPPHRAEHQYSSDSHLQNEQNPDSGPVSHNEPSFPETPYPHDEHFSPRPLSEDEPQFVRPFSEGDSRYHESTFVKDKQHFFARSSNRENIHRDDKQVDQISERKCWLCGEEGHMRRDCKLQAPQSMERRGERASGGGPLDRNRFSRPDTKPLGDSRSFNEDRPSRERRNEVHNFERMDNDRSRDRSRTRLEQVKADGRPFVDYRQDRNERYVNQETRRSDSKNRCHLCGKEGHFMNNCKFKGQLPVERRGPPPVVRRGPPTVERRGPLMERRGPLMERRGPLMERRGPPMERRGPPMERRGQSPPIERRNDGRDHSRIEQKLRDEARKIDKERELLRSKRKQLEREKEEEEFSLEPRYSTKRSRGGNDFDFQERRLDFTERRMDHISRPGRYRN